MNKTILNWYTNYKLHLLIWIAYMIYESVALGILFNDFRSPLIYLSHYLIVILLFYVHAGFALNYVAKYTKKSIWLTPLIILLELIAYIIIQYLVTVFLILIGFSISQRYELNMGFILRNLYRGILFMGFSTGYYFLSNYIRERKKTERLEKERLEKIIQQQRIEQELVIAQNAFLKAQINPHFLFNTLDFIYHKVNTHSEVAGEAIVKLAQMMRFAIDSDEMENTIYLSDEIEQVENLLYLYQIRKTDDLNVHFSYTEEVKQLRLIPLIILTLMENIFKHGNISKDDDIALLNLKIENNCLIIQSTNLINSNKIENSNHSGLSNIQKRLNYAYGNGASFKHQTVNQYFKVNIQVPVKLLKGPI
jgi:two-component system LytT family sensor kinase